MTRVLMTTDAVGGVWQYTLDLGRALRARGVEVRVAVVPVGHERVTEDRDSHQPRPSGSGSFSVCERSA